MSYACPRCGITSHSPNDGRERYCGRCHEFMDDEPLRWVTFTGGDGRTWTRDEAGTWHPPADNDR